MQLAEAAEAPLERPARMQVDSSNRRTEKREAEQDVEDLYREEQGTDEPEVIGVNFRGLRSGGENTDLSHRQVNGPDQMDANHLEKEFHSRRMQCSKKRQKLSPA